MNRSKIPPILEAIPASRQEDARHYGVHPYFTRRPANVIRAYVDRYSVEGDVVLDPFGGTGVTAIEAFLLGRNAIHNDLNPFANFIAGSIVDTRLKTTLPLRDAFLRLEDECVKPLQDIESSDGSAKRWLKKLSLPDNIRLPKNSDAEFFYEMFTPKQLAGLALIKGAIERETNETIRGLLLLAWSASVAKLNKTFLSAKGRAASRGGSSIFSIYRYKLASKCVELPIWGTFKGRLENVVAAKEEVVRICNYMRLRSGNSRVLDSKKDFHVMAQDAAVLDKVLRPHSVDYIFTDPPYGAFISYLDLSILWNHWLGFTVSDKSLQSETIVGGEQEHSEEHYKKSLTKSIQACFRILKPDRWFSIVFQHWDPTYFSSILETASDCGAELKSAITQTGDVIWSMHKKKNSASVIAGEMIITFYKPKSVKIDLGHGKSHDSREPEIAIDEVIDTCLGTDVHNFTSEALFNRIIIELWHRRELRSLSLSRKDFAHLLEGRGWHYNPQKHLWVNNSHNREPAAHPLLF